MNPDSELPPLDFIGHNKLFNEGTRRMIAVANSTNAPPEVITWLYEQGKIALHAAYNTMRDES